MHPYNWKCEFSHFAYKIIGRKNVLGYFSVLIDWLRIREKVWSKVKKYKHRLWGVLTEASWVGRSAVGVVNMDCLRVCCSCCFQMKIVCGTLESLGYAVSTLLQLMSLYKGEQEIHIPTLLVSCAHKLCLLVPWNILCPVSWCQRTQNVLSSDVFWFHI